MTIRLTRHVRLATAPLTPQSFDCRPLRGLNVNTLTPPWADAQGFMLHVRFADSDRLIRRMYVMRLEKDYQLHLKKTAE
jgi:hypothetical protein